MFIQHGAGTDKRAAEKSGRSLFEERGNVSGRTKPEEPYRLVLRGLPLGVIRSAAVMFSRCLRWRRCACPLPADRRLAGTR